MEFIYVYNFQQSLFFIQSGVAPIDIGIGGKGDVYHKFIRDEKLEVVFTEWIGRVK